MSRIYGMAKMAYQVIRPFRERQMAGRVCNYYKGSTDREVLEVLEYIKKNKTMKSFNYPFAEKYRHYRCLLRKDRKSGLFLTKYHGHRMYFSRDYFTSSACVNYMRSILTEQDPESPHRYLTDSFDVDEGSVVVGAGVAEGNFSLDILEKASRLILVEYNRNWLEALEKTFAKEIAVGKVEIVPKLLGDHDDHSHVSIDYLYQKYGKIDFVKLDIEGGEENALRGGGKWMRDCPSAKLAVCAYHKPDAFHSIWQVLENQNLFHLSYTKGYMYFPAVIGDQPPYLRRGLIRAVRRQQVNRSYE